MMSKEMLKKEKLEQLEQALIGEKMDTLSDFIIKSKITPIADQILKNFVKRHFEKELPNWLPQDELLVFLKTYEWYKQYINEYVRLFDIIFKMDLSLLNKSEHVLKDFGEEIGIQMTGNGIVLSYFNDVERSINEFKEILASVEDKSLHLLEISLADSVKEKLDICKKVKGLREVITPEGEVDFRYFIDLLESNDVKITWLEHKEFRGNPSKGQIKMICKQGPYEFIVYGNNSYSSVENEEEEFEKIDLKTLTPLIVLTELIKFPIEIRENFLKDCCRVWELTSKIVEGKLYILKNDAFFDALTGQAVSFPSKRKERIKEWGHTYYVPFIENVNGLGETERWLCLADIIEK